MGRILKLLSNRKLNYILLLLGYYYRNTRYSHDCMKPQLNLLTDTTLFTKLNLKLIMIERSLTAIVLPNFA